MVHSYIFTQFGWLATNRFYMESLKPTQQALSKLRAFLSVEIYKWRSRKERETSKQEFFD